MGVLEISLLGPVQATLDGQPLPAFRTRKVLALLAHLLVESIDRPGEQVAREELQALLWPGMPEKSAQDNLRQILYLLRQAIPDVSGEDGQPVPLVLSGKKWLQLNPAAATRLDVAVFTRLLQEGGQEQLEQAVALYRGDFLAGFYLADSNEFEMWAAAWRQVCREQAMEALGRLARGALQEGQPEKALAYARRQLEIDNLRESAYRQLMEALARSGQRAQALAAYERCRRLLAAELDVQPEAETEALAAAIRDNRLGALQAAATAPAPESGPAPLPVAATPFVGRATDVAKVGAMLVDAAPLVTIIGPGGIGKTRLALEVAQALADHFPDGVVYANLAPLPSADAIVPALAQALGFSFHDGDRRPPKAQLFGYLRTKKMLLVLDDFEHLLEGAQLLAELWQAAPGVQFLVTSRDRLKLQIEHTYQLQGLASSRWNTLAEAQADPAVQLFVHHAQRARPSFALREDHLPALHHILRLVQGMPLAIVLAAGWVTVLSPAEIAAEIASSLDFLETITRDGPDRQRSVRALFQATWARLDEEEERVYAALSIFRSGFTLAAARSVAGATPRDLMQLADRSLLSRVQGGRFEQHELLRQFAAEELARLPEAERFFHERHATYYSHYLQEREEALKGAGATAAEADITAEYDNIVAAWDWAAAHGQEQLLREAAGPLGVYHVRHYLVQQGQALFGRALEKLGQRDAVSARTRGLLLAWQSLLAWVTPQKVVAAEPAEQMARQALALLKEAGDGAADALPVQALALRALGRAQGDADRAKGRLRASLEAYTDAGLRWEMAWVHHDLAALHMFRAEYHHAYDHYREAQQLVQLCGDSRYSPLFKSELGYATMALGQLEEAEAEIYDALAAFTEADSWHAAWTHERLCELLVLSGRFREAVVELAVVRGKAAQWADPGLEVMIAGLQSWAMVHLGNYEQAEQAAGAVLAMGRQVQAHILVGLGSLIAGCAALAQKKLDVALAHMKESATTLGALGQRREQSWALSGLTYIALRKGDTSGARQHLAEAVRWLPDYYLWASALLALPAAALYAAAAGEPERAIELDALAKRYGFVANSVWFEDVAGRRLAEIARTLPPDVGAAARARGAARELWATIAEVERMTTVPARGALVDSERSNPG